MNCRPGDIALVVNGPNTGVVVEVIKYHGHFMAMNGDHAPDCWLLKSLCEYRFDRIGGPSIDGYGSDSRLMPIGKVANKHKAEPLAVSI